MSKITQTQIAKAAGVNQSFISLILAGKKTPSAEVAKRLEQASGWSRNFWLYPDEYSKDGLPLQTPEGAPYQP